MLPPGLNRTSVGLKPLGSLLSGTFMVGPQSNQRGIETEEVLRHQETSSTRLNRTSVGLKLLMGTATRPSQPSASIEPAWD